MTAAPALFGMELLWLLALGVALLGVLAAARWALDLVPMSKARRAAVARARPVAGAAALFVFLLFAARELLADHSTALLVAVGLVVVGFALAAWPAFRDLLAGVALKAGRVCQTGDHVRIGDIEGRVARMGYRAVVIETTRGDEAILPYSRVERDAVIRTRTLGGVVPHEFRVQAPARLPHAEARALVRRAALLSHWSVPAREPEIAGSGDALDVTVFALDADHAPEIEARVRRALESRDAPPRPRELTS